MTSTDTAARLAGRRRLDALRRRAHRIRVWVACVAVVTFMALVSIIYVQMSRGHDPVLGAGTAAVATSTQSTSTSASSSSADTSQPVAAPMTTQQS